MDGREADGHWQLQGQQGPARRRQVFLVQVEDGGRVPARDQAAESQGAAFQGDRGSWRVGLSEIGAEGQKVQKLKLVTFFLL